MGNTDNNLQNQQTESPDSSAVRPVKSWLSYLRLHCSMILLLVLVIIAGYLASGRLLMSMVSTQKDWLQENLINALGIELTIGEVEGAWFGFSPIIRLYDLEINQDQSSDVLHSLRELDVTLDIPRSLWQREFIINRIIIDQMALQLVEDEAGVWGLSGFATEGDSDLEPMLNTLFNTSRLQISEAQLKLDAANGISSEINNIYLDIQNQESDHQVQLQFRLNNQISPVQMSVRLVGDPLATYTASAYLDFDNLDLASVLAELPSDQFSLTALESSGQLWAEFDNQGINEVQSSLREVNVSGIFTESAQAIQLSSGSADLTAVQTTDNDWSLWAQNLEFDFFNRPWESGDFFIQLNLQNETTAMDIYGESVDLAIVTDMLDVVNLSDYLRQILDDLNPQGHLRNLRLQTDLSGDYPGMFSLQANLDDVAVDAWGQAPSGSGIFGYLEADQRSGFVELDSTDFTIHLPEIFQDSWHYNYINSRVYWDVDDKIRVSSDIIDVQNEQLHGRVQFELENQLDDEGRWDTDLTLLVGVLDFDASYKSRYLPTLSTIRGTMNYIDDAVLSGTVHDSAFVFRGKTTNLSSSYQRNVQTYYQVENASVRYLNDWPVLENIYGFVTVDNNDVDVSSSSAVMAGMTLGPTKSEIRPITGAAGSWLALVTEAMPDGNTGLSFIRESPIRDFVGPYLDSWLLEGDVALEVQLGIPLNNPQLENDINVQAITMGNTLTIPEYDLVFSGIRGPLNFSSINGLQADGLSASLFGFPIATRIDTSEEGIVITGNGRVSKAALQQWSLQPEFIKTLLDYSEGELSYTGDLIIFNELQPDDTRSELMISSDLLGMAFALPQPFDKGIEEAAPLQLNLDFAEGLDSVAVNFRDQVSGELNFLDNEFYGGEINFGARNQEFTVRQLDETAGLLVRGEVSDFNFQEWQEIADSFSSEDGQPASELVRLVDVRIGNLNAFGIDLPAVDTVLARQGPAWDLYLENDMLQGNFLIPDAAIDPYEIELSYLRLPRDEEEEDIEGETPEEDVDPFADVNPAELPAINFRTEEFSLGEGNLGAWQFQLRNNARGATISELSMLSQAAAITDLSRQSGATLDWEYSDGVHRSNFNGVFSSGDLAVVLPNFGYAALLQSESSSFVSNIDWSGSPAAFSLKKISGQVNMEVSNGRFIDIEPGSARLFGAFNFDALVRRLQLDFSDLFGQGLAYDSIEGVLNFNEGTVTTEQNLLIRGPSSTINVDGEINLPNETIAADVLVNLPLGQNVSVLAGILGAWPIAIGTYVASRIFSNQLENFTTVLYRLEGPWDDPQAGFAEDDQQVEQAMEEIGVLTTDD